MQPSVLMLLRMHRFMLRLVYEWCCDAADMPTSPMQVLLSGAWRAAAFASCSPVASGPPPMIHDA